MGEGKDREEGGTKMVRGELGSRDLVLGFRFLYAVTDRCLSACP
jgi:hypothetical protein